jgi:hypothetical protein
MLKTDAIGNFLADCANPELASLYSPDMECQVNVAQDGGDRIEGDFKGKKWHGWSDGKITWKSFRIPWKANTDPEYTDSDIKFSLLQHAEAIGMTGWDWRNRCSKWVAFDFDAISGHGETGSRNLTAKQLDEVKEVAFGIDWITIRKSTSGSGIHLYVFLDNVPTRNHNEHAALARAILGTMSALTGFNFQSKVDVCGGNMWVWHRKNKGTDGFDLIKQGTVLKELPCNWRDHIKVVKGTRRRTLPQFVPSEESDSFDELAGACIKVDLDEEHRALINYLQEKDCLWWWEADHHMLVTHTIHLKQAAHDLDLRGFFDTISTGKEIGQDHNCFLFPMRRGAWGVRRYTKGVQEHQSWVQDGAGWTKCFFNKEVDLPTACTWYLYQCRYTTTGTRNSPQAT